LGLGVAFGQITSSNSISTGGNTDSTLGIRLDSAINARDSILVNSNPRIANKVDLNIVGTSPYISVQQFVKGSATGIYVNEPSGEPGYESLMYIRGLSSPILSHTDVYNQQPTVYVNGVPTFQGMPLSFAYQYNDLQPIGTATNLLADLDPNEIEKIEVIKDPASLAKLGPNAANGVIWITTKKAAAGTRQFSLNSYVGIAMKPNVKPINAAYENSFRRPFYDAYPEASANFQYPTYLADSTDLSYYGPADWIDSYFKNKVIRGEDFSFSGGSSRANFRFFLNNTSTANAADRTKLEKYSVGLFVNMLPMKFLNVSAMVRGSRLDRDRNHSLTEAYSESRFMPDLSNPFPPSKKAYDYYLDQLNTLGTDNNTNYLVSSYIQAGLNIGNFHWNTKVTFDYNEGARDYFIPTTVFDGYNFLSSYSGFNERFAYTNSATYDLKLDDLNKLSLSVGQSFQKDITKYNYFFSYNTINDFVKVHNSWINDDGDLESDAMYSEFRSWPILDKEKTGLTNLYAAANYSFSKYLNAEFVASRSGSSTIQPDLRWKNSYTGSINFHIAPLLHAENIDYLDARLSAGQILRPFDADKFSQGPYYNNDLGWTGDGINSISSWLGISGIVRPYRQGWVGYNIPWNFSLKRNVALDFSLFKSVLSGTIEAYSNDEKNGILPITVASESGYTKAYESGLTVNNKGLELNLLVKILQDQRGLNWSFNINGSYNKNTLKSLPGGAQSMIIENTKLEVGQAIDQFWVYKNQGIVNDDSDIPTASNGSKINYNGFSLQRGDALWANTNGDDQINDDDRVLMGHKLPVFYGGFGSNLSYRKWGLDFQFTYATGNKYLNQAVQQHLDFVNYEGSKTVENVKEITYWQQLVKQGDYPLYNPWSDEHPYNLYQDMFLVDGSYLKLRSLSLNYSLLGKEGSFLIKNGFREATIYVTANNLFTLTKGDFDPEAVNYMGIYTGNYLSANRSIILGVKFKF